MYRENVHSNADKKLSSCADSAILVRLLIAKQRTQPARLVWRSKFDEFIPTNISQFFKKVGNLSKKCSKIGQIGIVISKLSGGYPKILFVLNHPEILGLKFKHLLFSTFVWFRRLLDKTRPLKMLTAFKMTPMSKI